MIFVSDLESENEVSTLQESSVQSQGKKTSETNILKTNAAKTNPEKTNAAKTNAANMAAEKPGTAKASSNKQSFQTVTNSRFKQSRYYATFSPSRHESPAACSNVAFSFQSSAGRSFSWFQKASFVDCNTPFSVKKPAQESSFDKNVYRITLKKSCEIPKTANRLEQKIHRLLGYQDNQHIEDLFDEVMKLPVDNYDSWLMLEDLLTDKRNCIKLVGVNRFFSPVPFPVFVEIIFIILFI